MRGRAVNHEGSFGDKCAIDESVVDQANGSKRTAGETADDYGFVEDLLNTLTHGMGVALSAAGTVLLIIPALAAGDGWKLASFCIFGASLILLYLSSMLYHGFSSPALKRVFKLLDHCAIYLLIAGTYTPFLLVNMRHSSGWLLFALIWSLALAGIVLKVVYGHRFKLLRVGVYLFMGWLVLFAAADLAASLNTRALYLLVAGGLTYTLGVIFYLARRIPFNHAIWHLFVVAGSICHYGAVYFGVLPYN